MNPSTAFGRFFLGYREDAMADSDEINPDLPEHEPDKGPDGCKP